LIDFHFIISYLLEKFNEKANFLIRRANDVFDKEDNRQTQQNQILLSLERFDKNLQAVELIIIFESNRLSLMQVMHDQFASNHSKINRTIRLLKKIIADQKWYETSSNTFEIVILVEESRQREINIMSCWTRYRCRIDHEQTLFSILWQNYLTINIIMQFWWS
jgi:CRISPR/Cas system CMR subunit Cmr4 (Cas7 group RAMP superfamily)